jgi:hypothetical protein
MESEFCDTCCLFYNAVQNRTLGKTEKLKKKRGLDSKIYDMGVTNPLITYAQRQSLQNMLRCQYCTACHDDAIKIPLPNSNLESSLDPQMTAEGTVGAPTCFSWTWKSFVPTK